MNRSRVCGDSNLVLKLVKAEVDIHIAEAPWGRFGRQRTEVVAPVLLRFGATLLLRNAVVTGRLSTEGNRRGLDIKLGLGIVADSSPELHSQAWELATQLGLPNVYDAHYLALSQILCCQFWTADARLHGSVSRDLPWVVLLGRDAGRVMGTAPPQDPWYNDRFRREVH